MPHLNAIVKTINDHLKANALKSKAFQGGMFYGLAKKVLVKDTDGETYKPAVITSDGKGTEVTPDETYQFSLYHRCLNGTFNTANPATSWGDASAINQADNMMMIVYADPAKVKTTQEDLAFIIAAGLPQQRISISDLDTGKIAKARIIPLSFENDSKKVFMGEYESEFTLKPEAIYFSLSYRIETDADRDCVICP